MNTFFTLTLLSSAAFAGGQVSQADQGAFMQFTAKYNNHYEKVGDIDCRQKLFLQNQAIVDEMNNDPANEGVFFKINETGDMTDEEFNAKLGLDETQSGLASAEFEAHKAEFEDADNMQQLQNTPTIGFYRNWANKKKVIPVQNQGGCGSCWSFAASTAQSAMQAIQTGKKPIRLSEQEGVDCVSASYGCRGGWVRTYWEWSMRNGSTSNWYYPYVEKNQSCRNQDKKKLSKVKSIQHVKGVTAMKKAIQEGPMTIAVSAGNHCWRYYKSGVLSSKNNCPKKIDHAVVIVGARIGMAESCRPASWKERQNKQCSKPKETLMPNKKGNLRRCCIAKPDIWIVQNSWGTKWGKRGFVHMAIEQGDGVSGMNVLAQQVKIDPNF